MKVKVFRSKGEGPFVGTNYWKSKFHKNHWYAQLWVGNTHIVLSRNANG